MINIEKTLIKEKWKTKKLEIREFEEQLRKQYDEIQELMTKLGKRLQLRKQNNSRLF